MTNYVVNSEIGTTTDSTPVFVLNSLDQLFLGQSGLITATGFGSTAIVGTSCHLYLNGGVFASNAVALSLTDTFNFIDIGTTGSIQSLVTAVYVDGNASHITNRGTVSGNLGFYITGGGNTILNYGYINSFGNDALFLGGATGENGNDLTNYGSISGSLSYNGGDVTDHIINLGNMSGGVSLGGGGDLFDNRYGTLVNGGASGGDGDDYLYGSSYDDTFSGDNGNDQIFGYAGDDSLFGGADNDTIDGGIGADMMDGGAGNDIYVVDNIGDIVTEFPNAGADTVRTKLDTYTLGANVENMLFIGPGNFIGIGNNLNNVIVGGAGDDRLLGGVGNDTLNGRAGNDVLNGGVGADVMAGGADNDTYFVDNVADKVHDASGGGSDTVYASANFTLEAGQEVEFLRANAGAAGLILTGNEFNNTIIGLGGNDTLMGGSGNDTLNGGAGIDRLAGGAGNDNLTGGPNADSFIFDTPLNALTNVDRITDFTAAADRILLNQAVFTAAGAPGTLAAGVFVIGANAQDANDRIIYNSGTGALIYDSNGNIAGGATQFATLSPGLTLTNANFVIV
jgi:Ca2+-binding RTX toxin-like protein